MLQLEWADGVMLGRAAYQTPYVLAEVDSRVFGAASAAPSRDEVLRAMIEPAARYVAGGGRLHNLTRHMLGLYHGQPRGRAFRRHLSEQAVREGAGVEVLEAALAIVRGAEPRVQREAAA